MIFNPFLANSKANAFPIPSVAPVTIAIEQSIHDKQRNHKELTPGTIFLLQVFPWSDEKCINVSQNIEESIKQNG
jgi:hypothetical protein